MFISLYQIADLVAVAETIQDQIQIGIGDWSEQIPGDPVDLLLLPRLLFLGRVEIPLASVEANHMDELMRRNVEEQR
jgi:hypothetical protein